MSDSNHLNPVGRLLVENDVGSGRIPSQARFQLVVDVTQLREGGESLEFATQFLDYAAGGLRLVTSDVIVEFLQISLHLFGDEKSSRHLSPLHRFLVPCLQAFKNLFRGMDSPVGNVIETR